MAVGMLLIFLGVACIAAGVLYWLMEGRYSTVALYIGVMWGAMLLGLGLTLTWPHRRIICLLGAAISLVAAVLVLFRELSEPSLALHVCALAAVLGVVLGLVFGLRGFAG